MLLELFVPGAGEKVGAPAAGKVMMYGAEAIALCVKPAATAIALIVVVAVTVIDPVYDVETVVSVVPLVV